MVPRYFKGHSCVIKVLNPAAEGGSQLNVSILSIMSDTQHEQHNTHESASDASRHSPRRKKWQVDLLEAIAEEDEAMAVCDDEAADSSAGDTSQLSAAKGSISALTVATNPITGRSREERGSLLFGEEGRIKSPRPSPMIISAPLEEHPVEEEQDSPRSVIQTPPKATPTSVEVHPVDPVATAAIQKSPKITPIRTDFHSVEEREPTGTPRSPKVAPILGAQDLTYAPASRHKEHKETPHPRQAEASHFKAHLQLQQGPSHSEPEWSSGQIKEHTDTLHPRHTEISYFKAHPQSDQKPRNAEREASSCHIL